MNAHRKDLMAKTATMEHRHFATIATIIRNMTTSAATRREVTLYFADQLDGTNPRFDRARFIAACLAEG